MEHSLGRIAGCHTGGDALRWMVSRRPARWPRRVEQAVAVPPPDRVEEGEIRALLVGHSTVLLQVDGWNLLFDPIWSARCSPVPFAGPRRVRRPALRFADLPPVHAVLLSHNHYDHCDKTTLRRLAREHRPQAVTGTGNGALLRGFGLQETHELGWWQATRLDPRGVAGARSKTTPEGELAVHYIPAQHFSGRGLADRNRALWGGFVLESRRGPICFVGDTGYHVELYREVRRRFGPITLAFIPIGAYAPRWFMKSVHCDPEEAVGVHHDLDSRCSLAIHHATFQLTDEPIDEPGQRLIAAREQSGLLPHQFRVVPFGESVLFD